MACINIYMQTRVCVPAPPAGPPGEPGVFSTAHRKRNLQEIDRLFHGKGLHGSEVSVHCIRKRAVTVPSHRLSRLSC